MCHIILETHSSDFVETKDKELGGNGINKTLHVQNKEIYYEVQSEIVFCMKMKDIFKEK